MSQRIRERRFEKLNSKGEIIEIIEETFKGKTEAFGKMLLQTSNHNLYHSGTRTLPGEKRQTEVKKEVNDDIKKLMEKRKEKESKEKLRTKKGIEGRDKNILNENKKRAEQEKKLYYENEGKNKIKTNNILEGNNNKVEKKLNNDNNFSIIKNVELKTFYTDYIQKKFIADENAFPNRNSLTIKNN